MVQTNFTANNGFVSRSPTLQRGLPPRISGHLRLLVRHRPIPHLPARDCSSPIGSSQFDSSRVCLSSSARLGSACRTDPASSCAAHFSSVCPTDPVTLASSVLPALVTSTFCAFANRTASTVPRHPHSGRFIADCILRAPLSKQIPSLAPR
jgi:hypothetical protein